MILRLAIIVFLTLVKSGLSAQTLNDAFKKQEEGSVEEIKNLPLIFRENAGQWDPVILYKGNSPKGDIYFLKDGLIFTHSRNKSSATDLNLEHLSWKLSFEGINDKMCIQAGGKQTSHTNYFLGSNVVKRNIPDYNQINYLNLYPDINLRYYGSGKNLKYDYILKPGADIKNIRMKCEGIENININKEGELELKNAWGIIKENKPFSYQIIDGIKKEVDVRFSLINENTFGFKIFGEYDKNIDLTIDPVTLIWGTYVGGNIPTNGGYLFGLTMDASGDIYATGYYPNTFPVTTGAYDQSFNDGTGDVFVFKLNSAGNALSYATYIGGNGDDRGNSIAVNNNGEAYITGYTTSATTSFPANTVIGTAIGGRSVFVCKLNAGGSSLDYSTYIGGMNHDIGNGIKVDASGNAFVTGETQSSNFPSLGSSFDLTYNGGSSDAFVFKLNPAGNSLLYSTFIGGSGNDRGRALALNNAGVIFLTGQTNSANYPATPGAYDNSINGDFDAFVTKINTSTGLVYSTFTGGTAGDEGASIDINFSDEAFITGYSFSPDYPTTTGSSFNGLKDAIVTKLNSTGSSLIYSRFVGGSDLDEGTSIIVNARDQVFIAGNTESTNFPIAQNGIVDPDSLSKKESQVFVLMLNPTGTSIRKSVTFGGSFDEYKVPSLSSSSKNIICEVAVGFTSHSPDLITTNGAFQKDKLNGNETNDQPAVYKLYVGPIPLPPSGGTVRYCPQEVGNITTVCGPPTNDPDFPMTYSWSNGSTSQCISVPLPVVEETYSLTYTNGCETKTVTWTLKPYKLPSVSLGPDTNICKNKTLLLTVDLGPGPNDFGTVSYLWSTLQTTSSINISSSGTYWVRVTTSCGIFSDTIEVTEIDKPIANLGPDRSFCSPFSYILNAFNPANTALSPTYLWSTGATSSSININSGGTYWVDVINECGTVRDSITINELLLPIVNLGNDTSLCQFSDMILDAGNPALPKIWSTGATTQTISINTPGIYWVDVSDVCGTIRDSIIIQNATGPPVVDLGPDQMICSAFSLLLDAYNPPANYYWSTGDTTANITVSSGGVYSILLTNGCGIDRDTITIIAPPSLNLDLGPDIDICNPQTATLTAGNPGGSVAYLWSTGESNSSITVNAAGKYWVRVSNECGTASDTINLLIQQSSSIINLGNDTSVCVNTDFILNANNPGDSYLWSTGEITQTITVNISADSTLWVDLTNACGTARDSIKLNVIPAPIPALGPDTSICSPASLLLNAGNPGATYLWSTGASTNTITVNSSGIYYADITRCITIRDSIRVTLNTVLPLVDLGNDTTICTAFSKILDAGNNPGATFLWSPQGESTQTITVSVGKLYSVAVTNGCGTAYDSINIIGLPYPNLGPDVAICILDTIILDAGNGDALSTYLWSTNEITQTIDVFSTGIYTVEIINSCGTLIEQIEVVVDTLPCVVDLGPDQRICAPANITLDAENPGSQFLWSTGAFTQSIIANATGLYNVTVSNGCGIERDSINIIIDAASPSVNLGPDMNICTPVNEILDAGNANAQFLWYPNSESTQTISVSSGGTYSVKAINSCGSDSTGLTLNEFFPPAINLGNDTAVCIGPLTLNAGDPGFQYFWTPNGETTQTINVSNTGTYTASTFNICGIFNDDINVIIDAGLPVINLGPDTNICSPSGYLLDAGNHPGASILWTPGGATTQTITAMTGSNYSVTVTNSCGSNSDDANIAPNPVLINAQPDTSVCVSDSIQLSTTNVSGYTYVWTPSSGLDNSFIYNPIAFPDSTTAYVVVVSDGTCINTDTTSIEIYPNIKPQIIADPLEGYAPLVVNFHNTNPAAMHTWIFGDGDTSYIPAPTHTYNSEAIYNVILITTSSQGCIEYDTISVIGFSLFIPNLITPNGDGKNDKWDLYNLYPFLNVEIYNRWGELIYKKDNYTNEWSGEGESDGIYYFLVHDYKYHKQFKGWLHLIRNSPEK
jgi:gliding motility-associated-like protein